MKISMKNEEPKHLDVSIERLNGESNILVLENKVLTYRKIMENQFFSNGKKIVIKDPGWDNFFEQIQKIKIWDIEKEYGSELMVKLWWHINIEYKEKKIVSCGINIYPDMKNEEESVFYKKLSNAISELTKLK